MNKLLAFLLCSSITSVFADTVDFKKYVLNTVPQEWTVYFDKKIESFNIEPSATWEQTLSDVAKSNPSIVVQTEQSSRTVRVRKNIDSNVKPVLAKKKEDCCVAPTVSKDLVAQLERQTATNEGMPSLKMNLPVDAPIAVPAPMMSVETPKVSWVWQKNKSVATNLRELSTQNHYIFTEKSWQVYIDGEFSDFMLDTTETFTGASLEEVYAQILRRVEYLGLKACFFENNYIKIVNRKESNGDTKCIEN